MPCQFGRTAECIQQTRKANPNAYFPATKPEPTENDLIAQYGANHVAAWKTAKAKYQQCFLNFRAANPDVVSLYYNELPKNDPAIDRARNARTMAQYEAMTEKCGPPPPPVEADIYGTD